MSLGSAEAGRTARRRTQAPPDDPAAISTATISASLLRKIEQGTRLVTPAVLASIARVLDLDEFGWQAKRSAGHRVSVAIPHIRSALDCYDLPDDGPIPSLPDPKEAKRDTRNRQDNCPVLVPE
jgi:transcriptional regulator with XRE-family HTH domain